MEQELLNKFRGAMLSAALGDALGAHRKKNSGLLRYTDDTAMTIALAESIIERGKTDSIHIAGKFAEHYEKEPWRGYGPGPPRIFRMMRMGFGPLGLDKRIYPGGSYGNGAAMRITPVALFYYDDLRSLRKAVEEACKPTHTHPLATEGALLEAASIAMAVKAEKTVRVDAEQFLEKLKELTMSRVYAEKLEALQTMLKSRADRWEVVGRLGNRVEAFNSVPTAIYAYLKKQDPMRSIEYAISLGGDTDTIACMAGAIAGAHRGAEALPSALLNRLENRKNIERLAEQLWSLKASQGIKP